MQHYRLSQAQIEFFSAYNEIGERVGPVDEALLARYNTPDERRRIIRAVRLSHEFELMFYDTVLSAPSTFSHRTSYT